MAKRKYFEKDGSKPHRPNFLQEEISVPLDLLPYGSRIETREGIVPWLPGADVELNMMGFGDALRTAVQISLTLDISIAVASLPMIAALKRFAWEDRRKMESSNDAEDPAELLVSHEKAGNTEWLYGEDYEVLEAVDHEMTLAGAHLLGCDLAHAASSAVAHIRFRRERAVTSDTPRGPV